MNPEQINVIIATDCGSTTTKAILIEKINGEYRQTFRGEAPTTVEAPFEDVTKGVLNAIQEIEELSGRTASVEELAAKWKKEKGIAETVDKVVTSISASISVMRSSGVNIRKIKRGVYGISENDLEQ